MYLYFPFRTALTITQIFHQIYRHNYKSHHGNSNSSRSIILASKKKRFRLFPWNTNCQQDLIRLVPNIYKATKPFMVLPISFCNQCLYFFGKWTHHKAHGVRGSHKVISFAPWQYNHPWIPRSKK